MNKFVIALGALISTITIARADARYSLPWQLRPATIDDVVRADTAAGVFDDEKGNLTLTSSTTLSAGYRMSKHWAPTLRLGFIGNNAPGAALDGTSFANPVAGLVYARTSGNVHLALAWATTIPIGTSGDDRHANANAHAITARPADAAMFDVDYLTEMASVDVAYVNRGFTVQGEVMLAPGIRVRGDGATFRTEAAAAVHVGYFIGSHVSVGSDVRYRVRLDDAGVVTAALGVRMHFAVGNARIHPGISYTRGFDDRAFDAPMINARANSVQIDLPVMF